MDYLKLLEESYEWCKEWQHSDLTKGEFVSSEIFGFSTYDLDLDEYFSDMAISVCLAISGRKTHEMVEDDGKYVGYIAMCNMPFFKDKIEWGCSIRGAWWCSEIVLESCGLFCNGERLASLVMDEKEWIKFVEAVADFYW